MFGPVGPILALLAVADGVLRGVAPCIFAEAVHHGVEMAIRQLEQVVYVTVHLDVPVQVYHHASANCNKYIKNQLITYLPNAQLGVVDDVIRHRELGLIFRRLDRGDLPDDATLAH